MPGAHRGSTGGEVDLSLLCGQGNPPDILDFRRQFLQHILFHSAQKEGPHQTAELVHRFCGGIFAIATVEAIYNKKMRNTLPISALYTKRIPTKATKEIE